MSASGRSAKVAVMPHAQAVKNRDAHRQDMLADWVQAAAEREELTRMQLEDGQLDRSPMFEFCRLLRGCPLLRECNDLEAVEMVDHEDVT